ncbi:prepilin-type N-terminal cleavage/methylation domain-containing protein [Deinobacterium chartae]|uniref:Prepilin-type N-terminal cleavage/methylation domain-containing protein n=1 Tax=Deinobacterium chartae TaxID=521158 RepID=A0A841I1Q3_9DEIO|nr:type II secretion system protein [Deinobacterium chartae]MBB6098238.1 prepilin-type N-terminal cleavage/methylation domain-containing protein [Deinobacterium chartae]
MVRSQGLTLIEVLASAGVIGILAAILLPNLLSARDAAQYTAATQQLNTFAKQLALCLAEGHSLPQDAPPNQAPSGCPDLKWPRNAPFNSTYDYENWDLGDGRRWVGFTFYGKENRRSGIPAHSDLGSGLQRREVGNNITYSLSFPIH